MGGSKKRRPPTPPKAPPPLAEDVSAEVIAPTMLQETARRARMGAYTTRGQRIGTGGQLLGAGPIQLANVQAAAEVTKGEKIPEAKTLESINPALTKEIKRKSRMYRGKRTQRYKEMVKQRRSQYETYISQRQKNIDARNKRKRISPEGGMVI